METIQLSKFTYLERQTQAVPNACTGCFVHMTPLSATTLHRKSNQPQSMAFTVLSFAFDCPESIES